MEADLRDPQDAAGCIAAVFEHIHREQMAGLPLLNSALAVETTGFRVHDGRVLGVLITPWLMNLVMLPGNGDYWNALELGHKQPQAFPSGSYKFMVNEIDGLGRCMTHSLYSPMREFTSQAHAQAAAEAFLRDLMTPAATTDPAPADEELLGRIMRGEETPELDMDALEVGRLVEVEAAPAGGGLDAIGVRVEDRALSRRDLLRGRLRNG